MKFFDKLRGLKSKDQEQVKEIPVKEIPADSGCRKCYNYNHELCRGRNCSCEAFRPNKEDGENIK